MKMQKQTEAYHFYEEEFLEEQEWRAQEISFGDTSEEDENDYLCLNCKCDIRNHLHTCD